MTRRALVGDDAARSTDRGRPAARRSRDHIVACLLQQALHTLARRHPGYAAVLTSRPALRLAGLVVAGLVESVTEEGRRSMQRTLTQVRIATTVEPGLDTNQLMDSVTGRRGLRWGEQGGAHRRAAVGLVEHAAGAPVDTTHRTRPPRQATEVPSGAPARRGEIRP